MHSPYYDFSIALTGEGGERYLIGGRGEGGGGVLILTGGRHLKDNDSGNGTTIAAARPVGQGGGLT